MKVARAEAARGRGGAERCPCPRARCTGPGTSSPPVRGTGGASTTATALERRRQNGHSPEVRSRAEVVLVRRPPSRLSRGCRGTSSSCGSFKSQAGRRVLVRPETKSLAFSNELFADRASPPPRPGPAQAGLPPVSPSGHSAHTPARRPPARPGGARPPAAPPSSWGRAGPHWGPL